MKFWLFLLVSLPAFSQFVDIPDTNFKACLVESYDTNSDGEISFAEAEAVTGALSCFERGINSVVGIEAFINIKTLNLSNGFFKEMPDLSLLSKLENMIIRYSFLERLSVLPKNLKYIELFSGKLREIGTELPESLEVFICIGNELKRLNSLSHLKNLHSLTLDKNFINKIESFPVNLIGLSLNDNQLTQVPALPASLKYLSIVRNLLTSIPELPNELISLNVSNNRIMKLPDLPGTVERVHVRENLLTEFPDLPNSIRSFAVGKNKFSNIPDLDSFPFLTEVGLSGCNLDLLPVLPQKLFLLDISENYFTELPILPENMSYLYFEYNQIRTLENLPEGIFVRCRNNWIDPSVCATFPHTYYQNYWQGNPLLEHWGTENHQLEDFILFYGNGYVYELNCGQQ